MSEFSEFLENQLQDPELKKEYDALDSFYVVKQAIITARNTAKVSQKELAKRTGIAQADISKIENGRGNPSLKTLLRIATALGMRLNISFEPISSQIAK